LVANSFRTLRERRDSGGEMADLLTFAITIDHFRTRLEIELMSGGAGTVVTRANLEDDIAADVDWHANRNIGIPFMSFERGISRLFSHGDLALLAADELDILQQGATYSNGYNKADSDAVKWFREILREMSKENKLKFVQFTTGTDRASIGVLSKVHIVIQRIVNTESLPVSHTCFSIIGLTEYRTKEEMRQKVSNLPSNSSESTWNDTSLSGLA
jgi:ubiquitin-protein ligase E3 A